jgi:hypothetical protein
VAFKRFVLAHARQSIEVLNVIAGELLAWTLADRSMAWSVTPAEARRIGAAWVELVQKDPEFMPYELPEPQAVLDLINHIRSEAAPPASNASSQTAAGASRPATSITTSGYVVVVDTGHLGLPPQSSTDRPTPCPAHDVQRRGPSAPVRPRYIPYPAR